MKKGYEDNANLPNSLPKDSFDTEEDTQIEYESYTESEENNTYQDEPECYDLPKSKSQRTMGWSLLSLILSLLSVALCSFWYVSFPLAVGAVVFAVISRRKLGYFDKMSVFGLIVGIVGFVFSAFSLFVSLSGVLDGLIK